VNSRLRLSWSSLRSNERTRQEKSHLGDRDAVTGAKEGIAMGGRPARVSRVEMNQ